MGKLTSEEIKTISRHKIDDTGKEKHLQKADKKYSFAETKIGSFLAMSSCLQWETIIIFIQTSFHQYIIKSTNTNLSDR